MKKTASKILFHKSIDTIPIANYSKITLTDNLGYMYDASFLECDSLIPTPEMVIIWGRMQDEYNEIIAKRRTAFDIIELQNELGKLRSDLTLVKLICSQLVLGFNHESYKELLENRSFRLDESKDLRVQGEAISKRSNNYQTQIRMVEAEIESLSNTGKQTELEDMVIAIHRHMDIHIDTHKTTAKEWLKYENEFIKEMSKKKRR